MKYYTIGIDIGTSAVKTVLTDENLHPFAQCRREIRSFFPVPGRVEQDAEEIYSLAAESISEILSVSGISENDIIGIGLDHQGESCLVWDKNTGKPVYPVITWQDRRTVREAAVIREAHGEMIRETTGQPADSYYSAFKLRWILDHTDRDPADLLAGTLNTYIIWRMSGGKHFITDPASANCTLLYDPQKNSWSPDLLRLFRIPREMLPEIVPAIGASPIPTGAGIPILASAPDSHAGMYGIGAVRKGSLVTTYGTGNFMHLVTGAHFAGSRSGLTSTVLFSSTAERVFQLNGICYTAGSAIKWLINEMGLLPSEEAASAMAESAGDSGGVTFIPAFTGLATPYWDENARGALVGLTAGVRPEHIVRAVLESIALQVANVNESMKAASGITPEAMTALGGMTRNEFLMQFQADMLGIPVLIPEKSEPCYGAAAMAIASAEQYYDAEACPFRAEIRQTYRPRFPEETRLNRLSAWQKEVSRCLN